MKLRSGGKLGRVVLRFGQGFCDPEKVDPTLRPGLLTAPLVGILTDVFKAGIVPIS